MALSLPPMRTPCVHRHHVRSLYSTTQSNNMKREQNATTIIIFATVKINRKTEHDKPIVMNTIWTVVEWSDGAGAVAVAMVWQCHRHCHHLQWKGTGEKESKPERERANENQACVFIFVTLYFEFDIYLGWKYTCNSHFFTERTHNIITHMCVQAVHSTCTITSSLARIICEIFMTVFRSHHANGVGVCVSVRAGARARIDNENTKPIKIAIIVAYNKTTLCTLWVYTIYISSISYFPI